MLPLSLRAQIWCPVEVSILRLPVCRTGALPSELTGQTLVGAEELESSTRRVRAGCVATNTSLPHGADAANRTRVSSVPGTRSATELRRLEALIGFEPMTCSFGRSRAGPLRYRAKCRYQVSGARCQKKGFPALLTPDTRHLTPRTWGD